MTRTEERLADALDAAARGLREDTLRPLLAPQTQRRRPALAAPLAAAAGLLLVVGVGAAVAKLAAPGQASGPLTGPPRYYVEAGLSGDLPTVHSTATGAVTDKVSVPHIRSSITPSIVASAGEGVFFAAVAQRAGERIYRFKLTPAGRVSDLAPLPGGTIGDSEVGVGAMAASPDGSRLAVALTPTTSTSSSSCSSSLACTYTYSGQNGHIDVVDTASGARSVWQGGTGQNFSFSVLSLSWTSDGNELAYLGQWCPLQGGSSSSSCLPGDGTGGAKAEVRTLSPATGGGTLTSGRLLFRTSPTFSDLPQAALSPDGSTITGVALTSPAGANGTPAELAVEQISVATGKPLRVLYRQDLRGALRAHSTSGYLAYVSLSADVTGRYWMLSGLACNVTRCSGAFNGWINAGQLMTLQPASDSVISEAW